MPTENGLKNLRTMDTRTEEERKAIGRMGGLASVEARKRKQTMQECMRALLEITSTKTEAREKIGDIAEMASDNPTIMEILNLVQIREAQNGNSKAFELVRDTAGFKPTEKQEITAEIMTDADRILLEKVAKRQGIPTEKQD